MTTGPGEPEPRHPSPAAISYSTGQDMMALGPQALHQDIAAKVEIALGKTFPQMEVRFKNVSLSADLVMAHDPHRHHRHHNGNGDNEDRADTNEIDDQNELPTLPNHVLKRIAKVATKKHTVTRHILKNVTGTFKPGTLTLILGQSGSGKSALMKLLSGRFPIDKEINFEGEITYNGMSREKLLKRLPQFVAYVTQHDKHFPTLTAKETLEFAHECCGARLPERAVKFLSHGTDEENAIAIEAARSVYRNYPDIVVQELGLELCQHTLVGNAMLRGISGGERKRVTTGEMEFGMKYVTLMDEISTGLDSAAAYDIINTQRSIAKRLHKTVIISLLQPSPEVFALFDNVMILNEGEVMYHGPCTDAAAYFESLGFVCPPRRDIADFLCDLGTNQQVQYQVDGISTVNGSYFAGRHPRLASEFAELFTQSSIYKAMEQDIEEPYDPVLISDAVTHMEPIPEFQQSFWASTWTLMKRQTKLQLRNTAFLKGRAMLVVIMGLVYGSVFYKIDLANIQVAIGVIFASILFLGLGQSSMLTTFYNAREVFYKQRAANFYRTSSYVLSNSVSHIPFAILESLIFGSMIYWMGNFVQEAGAFILFEVFLVLGILVFLAWFFLLAAVAPNLHIAKPLAMVSLLIFILFAGFVVTKEQIPDYMIWLYWLNPIAWTLRSMVVAQYRHSSLDKCIYNDFDYCTTYGGRTMGTYSLALFDVPSEKSWVVYGAIFMVAAYLLFMVIAYIVLEYHRYERPENISLPKEAALDATAGVSPATSGDEGATEDGYALVTTPRSKDVILRVGSERERKITPVTVAFQDLWYSVSVPAGNGQPAQSLDLLKGITGYALPGSMTALMGSSGAGKTTLMDVIAGRKTGGTIKGKILLNGWEASDLAVRRCTGYCEQMDIHSEAATFREALTFSAFLRQGADVPDSHKYDSVSESLELLGMEDIADHIIRGSSTEQMKRLTIGVELAAQPSVLFLDEPTSGLDARSAKVIMDGVRKVADSGRTILCTIHQPSSEVFHLFDSLLLLKRGGETVFFGDLGHEGSALIKYFEAVPGVPRIANGYNPATWMLEVIGAGVGKSDAENSDAAAAVNFVEYFTASENKRVLIDERLQEPGLFLPLESLQPVTFSNKRAATELVQLKFLMKRFFNMYWRTPSYNWTRLMISLFLGVLFGLVYLDSEYTTYQGINGGLGMIFLATAFIGIVSLISILPIAFEERASFYRERASQTYNSLWYFVCFTVVEIPYVAAGALLFTATFYPMVGFTGFKEFVFYWLNTALQVLFQAYMGQFLIFALPSIEVAAVIGVLFNAIFFLFMGFNPPAIEIPSGYKWLYAITPQRYSFSLLAGTVFGDCSDAHLMDMAVAAAKKTPIDMSGWPLGCQLIENAPVTIGAIPIKSYLDVVFGIKHHHLAQYFWIFMAMIVIFRVLAAFAMRYINHQKRGLSLKIPHIHSIRAAWLTFGLTHSRIWHQAHKTQKPTEELTPVKMLKEQDPMIELIREWIMAPVDESAGLHLSVTEVFHVVEEMVAEHVESPESSRLKKYLPRVKKIFLPLDLTRAAKEYDASKHFLSRKRVPPTFKEVRHILNLATINAIASHLKLVTFDADDTIYEDGGIINQSSKMVTIIVELLKRGIVVSLVTAAGYPGKPERYEERLRGILDALEELSAEERARFLVMGGECNYLLETYTNAETNKISLRELPGHIWKDGRGERWKEEDVQKLLDVAERVLRETTKMLHLPAEILRKDRAIGIINTSHKRFLYENLEEVCLTVQHELKDFEVPFCAFNGGNDVWVDIGNKALGIQALQKYVLRFLPKELQGEEFTKIQGRECLHVGDRFTSTGNDTRSRDAATTVWISNPSETVHIMKKLLKAVDAARREKNSVASATAPVDQQLDATVEAAINAATEASKE